MERELKALYTAMDNSKKPCVYVLGGVKVNDSIMVMENVLRNRSADYILTTGLVANIFLWGAGFNIGEENREFIRNKSYCEWVNKSKILLREFKDKIIIPHDVAVCIGDRREEFRVEKIPNKPIYDIGTETIKEYARIIREAQNHFCKRSCWCI